jgi:hypothetical protein
MTAARKHLRPTADRIAKLPLAFATSAAGPRTRR